MGDFEISLYKMDGQDPPMCQQGTTRLVKLPHSPSYYNGCGEAQTRSKPAATSCDSQQVKESSPTAGRRTPSASGNGAERGSPRLFFSTAFIDDSSDDGASEWEGGAPDRAGRGDDACGHPRGPLRRLQVTYDSTIEQRQVNLESPRKRLRCRQPAVFLQGSSSSSNDEDVGIVSHRPGSVADGKALDLQTTLKEQRIATATAAAHKENMESTACCSMRPATLDPFLISCSSNDYIKARKHCQEDPMGGVEQQLPPSAIERGYSKVSRGSQRAQSQRPQGPVVGLLGDSKSQDLKFPAAFPAVFLGTPRGVSAPTPRDTTTGQFCRVPSVAASVSSTSAVAERCHRTISSFFLPPWFQAQQHQQQHPTIPLGPPFPCMGPQGFMWAPAFPLGQPYWVANPWFQQRQGSFSMGGPLTHSFGTASTLPQQRVHRQPSGAAFANLSGGPSMGRRRSSTSCTDQVYVGLHGWGGPGGLVPEEPQQQVGMEQVTQQQPKYSVPRQLGGTQRVKGEEGSMPIICSGPRLEGRLRSNSCSRAIRYNSIFAYWRPPGPPACSANGCSSACCQDPPSPRRKGPPSTSHPGSCGPFPLEGKAPDSHQGGGPLAVYGSTGPISEPLRAPSKGEVEGTNKPVSSGAAAAGVRPAAAAAPVDGDNGRISEDLLSLRIRDGGPLAESPGAIGRRILRRLQTLKGILSDQATAEGPPHKEAPAKAAQISCGAPPVPYNFHRRRHSHGNISEPSNAATATQQSEAAAHQGVQGPPTGGPSDGSTPEGPANPAGDALPSAAAVPLGGTLGPNEGGLSLIAAGVPRLTLATLNCAGGPGGGPLSSSLLPRRAPPSVFHAPKWPASPEPCRPLAERPLRGRDRDRKGAAKEEEETLTDAGRIVSRKKSYCHSSAQTTTQSPDTAQAPDAEGTVPQVAAVADASDGCPSSIINDAHSEGCEAIGTETHPAVNPQGGDNESFPSQSTSRASETLNPEKAASREGPFRCPSKHPSEGPSPLPPPPVGPAEGRSGTSMATSAEGGDEVRDVNVRQAGSVPTSLCTPRNLQRLRVQWALWSAVPQCLRGASEQGRVQTHGRIKSQIAGPIPVRGTTEEEGTTQQATLVEAPAEGIEQEGLLGFPSVGAGLRGCKSCSIEFYLSPSKQKEGEALRVGETHQQGLAICK